MERRLMSEVRVILSWLVRVLRKGYWLVGVLPQVPQFLATCVPQRYLPSALLVFTSQGGHLSLTFVLAHLGMLLSTYLVHRETVAQERQLRREIATLQQSRPMFPSAAGIPAGPT
jgi:hypothetical protein